MRTWPQQGCASCMKLAVLSSNAKRIDQELFHQLCILRIVVCQWQCSAKVPSGHTISEACLIPLRVCSRLPAIASQQYSCLDRPVHMLCGLPQIHTWSGYSHSLERGQHHLHIISFQYKLLDFLLDNAAFVLFIY